MENETPTSNFEDSGRDWGDLTHVCLVDIVSRLPIADRWKSALFVCKSWFHAATDPCLFTKFDLEHVFEADPDHYGKKRKGAALENPRWWSLDFERKMDGMLISASECSQGELVEVRVRHCSDRALLSVAQRSPNLEVLSIRSCPNVTDMSLGKIALQCSMLRELDISYCYEISYRSLELIGKNCPRLTVLKRNHMNWLDPSEYKAIVPNEYLDAVPQDGDREAQAIAGNMQNLQHLELRFSKMSSRGLALIAEGCGQLEYLDLFGCANLTSRSMEQTSPMLKNLKQFVRPNFYIPRSQFNVDRYGHWQLYDARFQTGAFSQF